MRLLFKVLMVVPAILFSQEYILSLGEFGSVRYTYENERLLEIARLSPSDQVLYTHAYQYDSKGNLLLEDFTHESANNVENLTHVDVEYDAEGRVIRNGETFYKYDHENRLIEVSLPNGTVTYAYGPSGERISRTYNGKTESYLYFGMHEIAILDENGQLKELRIPGLSLNRDMIRSIAIETPDAIYTPIHDMQGNIVKLINIHTKEGIHLSAPDAWGQGLLKDSPTSWIFSGKHYDRDTGLVYFGARYYSPELKQWLTPDPACQSSDPYEYCLGDPTHYYDPDGRWAAVLVRIAWGAGAVVTSPVWGPYAAATAGGAAVGYLGYKIYKEYREIKESQESGDTQAEEPPFTWDDLGDDPTKCPGDGFVWKGKGTPASGKGSWVRGQDTPGEEILHPDFKHPKPIGPHWDYEGPRFPEGIRIKPDGSWEPKL